MGAKKKPAEAEYVTLEEAAEVLEITPVELQRSRYRGMEPGTLAEKKDGVWVWDKSKLTALMEPEPEPVEPVEE
jgi:hypothetical protein